MNVLNIIKIIIKAFGIYFLFIIATGFLELLNPILINQPFSSTALLVNLIIPIIFAYAFLIKSDIIANWFLPQQAENIQLTKPEFIHLLLVSFGFISVIMGLSNSIGFNYTKTVSDSGSGFSYGINFQLGDIILVILGYLILKNREKLAQYFTKKLDCKTHDETILK
ncbi:hypothetical protein [Sphingobacterium bovistauri]|uniref:DUF2975 domain-containing protein n=1 Tax=Sphingobacterium bovistauri TaxID=2781959 RepID=A0ABS7Z6N8_9SPHI|nr:hypothetical protein [Sphingobacterium bovistauri]MCA5005851.1 hypothetical protein [Sphingobacterium bovistauri]